jgi:hypothetical protein
LKKIETLKSKDYKFYIKKMQNQASIGISGLKISKTKRIERKWKKHVQQQKKIYKKGFTGK